MDEDGNNDWSQLSLDRVVIRPDQEEQLIFLRQAGGTIRFPIAVGLYEAAAVKNVLDHPVSSRPLTHELVFEVVKALGGRICYALIESLLGGVFYAKLAVRTPAGDQTEIDCRPSDALCVAHDAGAPIFATRELLEQVSTA